MSTDCRLASIASSVILWIRFTHELDDDHVPVRGTLARTKWPRAETSTAGGGGGRGDGDGDGIAAHGGALAPQLSETALLLASAGK